ncbi:type II toxin-antitoxin system RelE/ParE family toxin [Mesorhizobium sp. LHD-90]|uniref:type II toxin-antitoxin system RelE family toxin n=1 Tax=Mesorhizobium sp. LHD-90 TaxID=3071414 RepID=UPI0027DF80C7|nr:type II toxin-antitoxin system RelE/ParE family toxin [Mesorhizobium sp. LHD-90]MDQ6437138.1 type II toxin-antitoxin system RelE/ParE family toxin [Mesorhizobium sp. LHD-90]
MKAVIILPGAAKALRKHRTEAARLLDKINAYAADPATQANNVKALSGSSALRLRVGDFRIIFEETEAEIVVTKIGPRGFVYD